jgi:hypothetical protein
MDADGGVNLGPLLRMLAGMDACEFSRDFGRASALAGALLESELLGGGQNVNVNVPPVLEPA